MKHLPRAVVSLGTTITIVVASVGLAQASESIDPANEMARAISSVGPASDLASVSQSDEGFLVQAGGSTIVLPDDAATPVSLESFGEVVDVQLPVLAGVTEARRADDGTIVYTSDADASLAVQPLEDGSTRFLSVLETRGAPERFSYAFDGHDLRLEADGSVSVSVDGVPVGYVAAPWAFDADGTPVPTRYEVTEGSLVQIVDHTARDYAYPITADPWWNPLPWDWKRIGRATLSGLKKCGVGALAGSLGLGAGTVATNITLVHIAGRAALLIPGGGYAYLGAAAGGCVSKLIG